MRLRASGLCIDRGGRRILSDVTFALDAGALLVTGENGTGKSSLLRVLGGFLPPAAGEIRFEECDDDLAPPLHYIGHRDGLKAQLTARENLRFAAGFAGAEASDADPVSALAGFGLADAADVPVAYLSTGQRRRVALARLLVAPRKLWILDEPTSGLDARSVGLFEDACRAHLAGGGLLIAATHLPLSFPARELRLHAA